MRTSTPNRSRSEVATSSPAKGSSRLSRCSPPSTSVTFVPSEAQAWESSLPTGPPPSTIMLSGTCLAVVASRLFQARTLSRPSIGAVAAPLPVATTTALRAVSTSPPTRIRSSPSKRPAPRWMAMSRFRSHGTWAESSRSWITSSRRSRIACGSSSLSASTGTPGSRRASASRSAGRSSAFDGMQA